MLLDMRMFWFVGALGTITRGAVLRSGVVIITRPRVPSSASSMISSTSVVPARMAGEGGRHLSLSTRGSAGTSVANLTRTGGRGVGASSKMSNCHPGGWDPAVADSVVF